MMGRLKSHGALFAQSQVLRWRHVSLTVILYHHHLPCETIEFAECRVQFTFCSNKKLQLCIESVYHREKGQQGCDTQAMRRPHASQNLCVTTKSRLAEAGNFCASP